MGKNICIYNWEREGDAILFLRKEMVDSSVLEFNFQSHFSLRSSLSSWASRDKLFHFFLRQKVFYWLFQSSLPPSYINLGWAAEKEFLL